MWLHISAVHSFLMLVASRCVGVLHFLTHPPMIIIFNLSDSNRCVMVSTVVLIYIP